MDNQQRITAVSALLFALVLTGCADGSLTSAGPETSAQEHEDHVLKASIERSLSGRCETAFRLHPTQPAPPVVRQIDEGTCQLTHLGRSSFYSVKDINFATGTQVTTEATFTAANGDLLRAAGSGTSAPSGPGQVSFTATLAFVGGTGRFENATGEAHVVGQADLVSRTASLEIIDGRIVYDSSNRSGS